MHKRIDYIDILKAIGIILMVMGHISFGTHFYIFIHAFHMPLFFFISGYLYKRKDFKSFFVGKLKSLLLPYYIFGMLASDHFGQSESM